MIIIVCVYVFWWVVWAGIHRGGVSGCWGCSHRRPVIVTTILDMPRTPHTPIHQPFHPHPERSAPQPNASTGNCTTTTILDMQPLVVVRGQGQRHNRLPGSPVVRQEQVADERMLLYCSRFIMSPAVPSDRCRCLVALHAEKGRHPHGWMMITPGVPRSPNASACGRRTRLRVIAHLRGGAHI